MPTPWRGWFVVSRYDPSSSPSPRFDEGTGNSGRGKRRIDRQPMLQMHDEGAMPTEIAAAIECPRMQVYRIITVANRSCL